jgi:hypothetical protein
MNALALLVLTACPVNAGPVMRVEYPVGGPAAYPTSSYPAAPSWNGNGGYYPTPCGGDCCGTSCGEVVSCYPQQCCQSRPGLIRRIRERIRNWRHGSSCECCSECCASCDGCGGCCASGESWGGTSAGIVVSPGGAMPGTGTYAPYPVPNVSGYPMQPMPPGDPAPEVIPNAPRRVR